MEQRPAIDQYRILTISITKTTTAMNKATTEQPLTTQGKINAIIDYMEKTMKRRTIFFYQKQEVRTDRSEVPILTIRACTVNHQQHLYILAAEGNWTVVLQTQIYAEIICDHLQQWLQQVQEGKLETAF